MSHRFIVAAAAAVAFAPCTALAQEQVELVVWDQHSLAAEEVAVELIEEFEAANPNITVRREVYTIDQLGATAKTAMAAGTGPDIMYYEVGAGREMFRAGLMMDLSEFSEEFGWKDRYFPAGYSFGVDNGALYGLGLEYEYAGMFYNQTLFYQEGWEVPQTLEALLDFCVAAKEAGYIPIAHTQNPGYQNYFSFTMPLHNIVGVADMEKLLFQGEGRWDTPEVIQAINVFDLQMRDAGCFAPDVNGLRGADGTDMIIAGESLMLPIGTWVVGTLVEGTEGTYEIKMMPFPSIDGGPRVYTAGMGSLYMISAASEHPREAAQFLDFVLSEEAGKKWVETARFIPPFPVDTGDLEIPPLQEDVLTTLVEAGTGMGDSQLGYNVDLFVPDPFNTMMRDGFQAVMAGTKSAEQQAADLQALWDARDK